MTDMSSWFRNRTPAARSPGRSTPAFEHTDRSQTPLLDHDNGREDSIARDRASSRVSSLLSFGKSSAPVLTLTPADADTAFANTTDPDSIWYNPNLEQMVETMTTVMMTKDSCAPVPAEYNSCILHIIEGYRDLRQELVSRNDEVARLKGLQEIQMIEFEKLGLEWARREKEYKSEIKRLEIVLATGPHGFEAVSLARANSVIHGRPSGESIEEGIERIRSRCHRGASDNKLPLKVEFGTHKDIQLSQMLATGQLTDSYLMGMNSQLVPSRENKLNQQKSKEDKSVGLGLKAAKYYRTYHRNSKQRGGQSSDDSSRYVSLGNRSMLDSGVMEATRLDNDFCEKPLPDIPVRIQAVQASRPLQLATHYNNRQMQRKQSFSFAAGGDLEELANQSSNLPVARDITAGPLENNWGFPSGDDSKSSVATVVRDDSLRSERTYDTATIAAKRALANRSNTEWD